MVVKGTLNAGGTLVFNNGEADTSSMRRQWVVQPKAAFSEADGFHALVFRVFEGSSSRKQVMIVDDWVTSGQSSDDTMGQLRARTVRGGPGLQHGLAGGCAQLLCHAMLTLVSHAPHDCSPLALLMGRCPSSQPPASTGGRFRARTLPSTAPSSRSWWTPQMCRTEPARSRCTWEIWKQPPTTSPCQPCRPGRSQSAETSLCRAWWVLVLLYLLHCMVCPQRTLWIGAAKQDA